ncbi:MAG: CRISPR-associated protein Cas4 [Candidatus Zixiibacteriota bacterium]
MYLESDLLPISALQHLAFCERQWGLIYLEQIWDENPLTVAGRHLHDRVDAREREVRGDLRVARGLRIRSLRLGLIGIADVVEFHRVRGSPGAGHTLVPVTLPNTNGRWRALPVEYKHGRPKRNHCDEVQLCAQALCLEDMLGGVVTEGHLFYGKTHRRHIVTFDDRLRDETERLTRRLHELTAAGVTPSGRYERKCRSCSLLPHCQPKVTTPPEAQRAARYVDDMLDSLLSEEL